MATERAHDIVQILSVYMEAKLFSATQELQQAERWVAIDRNPYTEGRLLWAQHQLAAVQRCARDVPAWRNTIKRYRRTLIKKMAAENPNADDLPQEVKDFIARRNAKIRKQQKEQSEEIPEFTPLMDFKL